MTSRDATGLMARSDAAHDWLRAERDLLGWATLAAFAALNAPFLLRSLDGGSRKAKRALLARLGLPADALPHLGSWKADMGLLELVAGHIERERPETVVEFGTGASTLIIAQAMRKAGVEGSFISFEQHADFCRQTRQWLEDYGLEAEIRAVPLVPAPGGWPGLWYDHEPLPDRIDFLLIDGPPWTIHPFTRGAAATLFGRIPVGGTVMLDDGARPGERVVARRWRRLYPNFSFDLVRSGSKGTLIGKRLR